MNLHFASFFRTLQLMTQALLCKLPDLDETAGGPLSLHCSQRGPWAAVSITWELSLLGMQDGRPTAGFLSQSLSLKKIPK